MYLGKVEYFVKLVYAWLWLERLVSRNFFTYNLYSIVFILIASIFVCIFFSMYLIHFKKMSFAFFVKFKCIWFHGKNWHTCTYAYVRVVSGPSDSVLGLLFGTFWLVGLKSSKSLKSTASSLNTEPLKLAWPRYILLAPISRNYFRWLKLS